MLKRIKNTGILALVLAAGMAVVQPASALAADRPGRDGNHDQVRVDRNWNRGREVRDQHVWYGGRRDGEYLYSNRVPAPSYGYRYPAYAYPACPR